MIQVDYENEEIGLSKSNPDIKAGNAFKKLLPYLAEHKFRLLSSLLLMLTVITLSVIWPLWLSGAIDGPIAEQLNYGIDDRAMTDLLFYCLVIFLMQLGSTVFQYFQIVKLEIIGQDIMLKLKQHLFDHVLAQDISFFDRNPVGRLLARVESDTESLRMLFTNTVVVVIGDVLLMLGIYTVMAKQYWKLALVLALFTPALAGLIFIFHRITSHRFLEVRKRMADVTATLTELLQGMPIIQIFHRGEWARTKVWRANERKFSEDAFVNVAVCIFFNTLFFLEYVKIGMILLLSAYWHLSPGTTVFFIIMIWKEFEPIARTADQLGSFQKGIAGARRIFDLLAIEPKLNDPKDPKEWNEFKDVIRFENVWFAYENEDWILQDVTFELPIGKRVALAGVTGGGKTTIISLLLRLYDPQKGRITVDGIDIRELRRADLRKRFALVLQDIILFPGDIASNISLEASEISQEQIVDSAKAVAIDTIINRLPEGYLTEVSEKGSNFSRGERQLLSFARAMAINPDLLILDEATSSVDPETERTIQSSLKKLMAGRTSLIIAHRLATILDVDHIIVLKRGRIVEQGTHVELILQDGYYSKLFHLQFKNSNGVKSYG